MKKKHLKVLQDINAMVPDELKGQLMHKVKISPTIKKVFELAIQDETIDPEKRARWQNILDAGYLDEETWEPDPIIEKQMDDILSSEIKKAVEDGRLPNKINNEFKKKAKHAIKKLHIGSKKGASGTLEEGNSKK